jgi:signal transduction histidine kinase/CheY-like chemotaxis protein
MICSKEERHPPHNSAESIPFMELRQFRPRLDLVTRWLSASATDPQEHIRRRILKLILLLSAGLDLLFMIWILPTMQGLPVALLDAPEWWCSLVSLVASVSLYRLAKAGRVQLAARIFVAFAFIATWSMLYALLGKTYDAREVSRMLAFLILSQTIGGLLLDVRYTLLLAAGHMVGLASLPFVMHTFPVPSLIGVVILFGFSVMLSGTSALLHHLDLAETLKSRRQLEETVEELRGQILAREDAEKTKTELEGALLRTQRMEALARLAGGFAHDFNNALMGVLGQLERIRSGATPHQKLRIDETIRSVERASGLIKGMLSLTHPHDRTILGRPSDLAQLMAEGFSLVRGAVPRGIDIEVASEPGVWVLADEGQIVQVLLNLCVNARDALETHHTEGFQPRIRLSMGRASRQECEDWGLGSSAHGFAWLQVEDNGPGISDAAREKIFDPFFTTKEIGKGSGLGLWMCDAVTRALGGQIVNLPPGSRPGACFRLYLPACEPGTPAPRNFEEAPFRAGGGPTGRILLVDDDPSVRDNISMALAERGWDVTSAFDGTGALQRFQEDPDGFRLMILDLSLPGMPGREVFLNVRRLRPRFPILVISGYDLDAGAATPSIEGANGRLLKPFRTSALLREIDRIEASL